MSCRVLFFLVVHSGAHFQMYLGGGCYYRSPIALLFQLGFHAIGCINRRFFIFFINKIICGNFVGHKLIIKPTMFCFFFYYFVVENQVQGKQSPQSLF